MNVLHYRVTTPGSATLENIATLIYNRFGGPYTSWLPNTAIFSGVSVTKLASATPAAGPFYQVAPAGGTRTGGILPLQASGLIRLATKGDPDAIGGPIPAKKGRVYIPFVGISAYSATTGMLNTAGWAALNSIRTVIGPEVILTGGCRLQMVVKRTKTNPAPAPPTLLGFIEVVSLQSLTAVATQRRRGDFGKLNAVFGGVS